MALASCSELNLEDWELRTTARRARAEQCTVRDRILTGRLEPDDVLDTFAELAGPDDPDSPVVLRPEPRTSQRMSGAGFTPQIACDSELARVYLGNSGLGYVVAYDLEGRELWRFSVPGFRPVVGRALPDESTRGFNQLQESEGSVLGWMATRGANLAISYRNQGRWHQAVVHRTGVPVASIGPWDGVLAGADDAGWVFGAGGVAAHGTWKAPVEQLTLRLTAPGPDLLVEHFIAWNLPRPQDKQWTWRKCEGENVVARVALGKRFDPALDEIARQVHDGLGANWAQRIFEHDAVTPVLFRQDLSYDDWKSRVRMALLDAGADVDCMNYAREHGLVAESLAVSE